MTADNAGNSTGIGTGNDAYTNNERNQVTTIDGVSQAYLDQGNDLRRQTGSTRSIQTSLGVTVTQAANGTTFYLRDPNGTILSSGNGSTRYNYVTEPTGGHVAWLLNQDGTHAAAYRYAPYGKTTVYGNDGGNRFRWLSSELNITRSGGDGHYKLGARYYDTQGHFTQPDPLSGGMSDPRSMTSYNYAGGDPINQSDPSGYASCSTNSGYWTPPGCASSPNGGAEPPIGGYAMQNGGGERVFNSRECFETGIGTGIAVGTAQATVPKDVASALGRRAVKAVPYIGWAWTGYSVYRSCLA